MKPAQLRQRIRVLEKTVTTLRGMRDDVTGPWWVSFRAMLSQEQRDRIGLSEDRGAVMCITRLCAALNDAEGAIREKGAE